MTTEPSIESLRMILIAMAGATIHMKIPGAHEADAVMHRAIDELERLRAERDALLKGEHLLFSQRHLPVVIAERDALRAELAAERAKREEAEKVIAKLQHLLNVKQDHADAAEAGCEALKQWYDNHTEREAAVCPEDVGCIEYINLLLDTVEETTVERGRLIENLAGLIRQLVNSLNKHSPDNDTAKRAIDYLRREGLLGSILRTPTIEAHDARIRREEREAARDRMTQVPGIYAALGAHSVAVLEQAILGLAPAPDAENKEPK